MNKIGIAIITYNRPHLFRESLLGASFHRPPDSELVVVNDGDPYSDPFEADATRINLGIRKGVAVAKNVAIQHLTDKQCQHIFVIEDDIVVRSSDVWDRYINTAKTTGIHHLNFQHAEGHNTPIYTHKYANGSTVDFFRSPQGAFGYFNSNLFKAVPKFDDQFRNAFEHVDFEYQLDKKGLAPPFWYFPDIHDSEKYLTGIGNPSNSTITGKAEYSDNWQASAKHFISKNGLFTNQIPYASYDQLIARLNHLQSNYTRP